MERFEAGLSTWQAVPRVGRLDMGKLTPSPAPPLAMMTRLRLIEDSGFGEEWI